MGPGGPIAATKMTPKKVNKFLKELARTGNVTLSCRLAAGTRDAFYKLRRSDEVFAGQWDDAVQQAADNLEKEALRRAVAGVKEPVYYRGQVCGFVKRYSDVLLIFLLKGMRPEKFRERYEHSTQPGGLIVRAANISDDELAQIIREGKEQKG